MTGAIALFAPLLCTKLADSSVQMGEDPGRPLHLYMDVGIQLKNCIESQLWVGRWGHTTKQFHKSWSEASISLKRHCSGVQGNLCYGVTLMTGS